MCVLHLKNTVKGSLGSGDKRQNFHKRIIKTSLTPGEFIENIQLFKKMMIVKFTNWVVHWTE